MRPTCLSRRCWLNCCGSLAGLAIDGRRCLRGGRCGLCRRRFAHGRFGRGSLPGCSFLGPCRRTDSRSGHGLCRRSLRAADEHMPRRHPRRHNACSLRADRYPPPWLLGLRRCRRRTARDVNCLVLKHGSSRRGLLNGRGFGGLGGGRRRPTSGVLRVGCHASSPVASGAEEGDQGV